MAGIFTRGALDKIIRNGELTVEQIGLLMAGVHAE